MERTYATPGQAIECAHCHYNIPYGATICQGCQTHLIYGMPDGYFRYMKGQAAIVGIVLTLAMWFVFVVLYPILYGFFIVPVLAFFISWLLYKKSKRHAIATIPDNLISFVPPEEIAKLTIRKAMK